MAPGENIFVAGVPLMLIGGFLIASVLPEWVLGLGWLGTMLAGAAAIIITVQRFTNANNTGKAKHKG